MRGRIIPPEEIQFQPKPTKKCFKDLTGQTFHRLTVIGYAGMVQNNSLWYARCECGRGVVKVFGSRLVTNSTKSCGCLNAEQIGNVNRKPVGTIFTRTRAYTFIMGCNRRCYDATYVRHNDWGGRGITVCDEWRIRNESLGVDGVPVEMAYANFVKWLEAEYGVSDIPEGRSIDRQDNSGPYSPDNCRLSTDVEQGRNKRSNRIVSLFSVEKCVAEWAEHPLAGTHSRILNRLNQGWPNMEAVFLPKRLNGETIEQTKKRVGWDLIVCELTREHSEITALRCPDTSGIVPVRHPEAVFPGGPENGPNCQTTVPEMAEKMAKTLGISLTLVAQQELERRFPNAKPV